MTEATRMSTEDWTKATPEELRSWARFMQPESKGNFNEPVNRKYLREAAAIARLAAKLMAERLAERALGEAER